MNDLIGSHEAAVIMGITYEALHKRLKRGSLKIEPVGRIGRAYLWRRTDAARFAH